MRRPGEILAEQRAMETIVSLTSAFESLSSMSIAQTKRKVLISKQFFNEVWNIYKQIRMDVIFNFGPHRRRKADRQGAFNPHYCAGRLKRRHRPPFN
jgi:hypothetical protein